MQSKRKRKQDCSVQVTSTRGRSWTTPRGARRLVKRGMAEWVNATRIRMVERDHRVNCEGRRAHGARFSFVTWEAPPLVPRGFLHYPHHDQRSKHGKEMLPAA